MRSIYNFLFLIGFCLSAPFYFLKMWRRGNWRDGFRQRFAIYDARLKTALTNRHTIWIHAVSVGEVNIATHLIKALEERAPNVTVVVSTTTSTGMEQLRKKLPSHVQKIYYPIDRERYASRALRVIDPEAVILVEAEIWPNFLWKAAGRGIPLFLVNARLSARSYRGYRRFGFLFRDIFSSFTAVGAQDEADAERLRTLGCRPEAVHVIGNLKFDAAQIDERPLMDAATLLKKIGVEPGRRLIVAGSTHDGEEAVLAEIHERLRQRFPDLFLILVPRHFERGREVGAALEARRIPFTYRTEISTTTRFDPGELHCLIVNTTGELRYFYQTASVIFVGKSLTANGGQNPIEPGALGKAMVFGPNMQNFEPIAKAFTEAGGARQVRDAAALEAALAELLENEPMREEMGANARQVVRRNQGSIDRTVDLLLPHLVLE